MGRKAKFTLPRCHPSCHCIILIAMTSRFVRYGIRPRDFHHRLRKWKGIFLYRFSPSTGSLKHSCCRSFHHCQILTLLYTHYFLIASQIYLFASRITNPAMSCACDLSQHAFLPDFFFQLYCPRCPGMSYCSLFHSAHDDISHQLFICQQVFDFYRELF